MNQKTHSAGTVSDDDMMGEEPVPVKKIPEPPIVEAPGLIESPDVSKLETELNAAEEKLAAAEDRALRALAEVDNIRRRAERDVSDAHKYGIKKLLEELIPILDSLEQAIMIAKEDDHEQVKSMRNGMALTLEMLQKVLGKFGIKEINPLNEIFNPTFHEVMLAQENSEVSPNTILAVMQKGYLLHDRVVRPARVMIAKAVA